MKKVNKALALVLAAAMMTVTACGNGESGGSSDAASTPSGKAWGHGDRGGQHSGGRSEHP